MEQDSPKGRDPRATARELAEQAIGTDHPLEWFERLYRLAESGEAIVPWADRAPNPNLIQLLDRLETTSLTGNALIVGCGLGDDAEWFAKQGFSVTAFDISACAIHECCRRFPDTTVRYTTSDLFDLPEEWETGFDMVVESYTLQVLPHSMRDEAMRNISRMLVPGGHLLLVSRAREDTDPPGTMPWPLTHGDVMKFLEYGLEVVYFEDYIDASEESHVRRFRCCFLKTDEQVVS